ncbi:MAG: DNA (cytosine-5-)-methyltransferase [Promethearchaeota archaeon]
MKHLINHPRGKTFEIIKNVLEDELKYRIHYEILNARDFGVPQNRVRVFIVGFKKNYMFSFPKSPQIPVKIDDILESMVEKKYYLSQQYLIGLKKHRARHEAKGHGFGYEVIPRDNIANSIVCGGMGKERNLVKDQVLPDCWKKEGDDIQLRNNGGIRKMIPLEWARLQGFPDIFKFPISMTRAYRQLANSVTIPVIKAIALQMKKSLEDRIILGNIRQTKLLEGANIKQE